LAVIRSPWTCILLTTVLWLLSDAVFILLPNPAFHVAIHYPFPIHTRLTSTSLVRFGDRDCEGDAQYLCSGFLYSEGVMGSERLRFLALTSFLFSEASGICLRDGRTRSAFKIPPDPSILALILLRFSSIVSSTLNVSTLWIETQSIH